MKNIIFLVSGNGGTLKFLAEAIQLLQLPFTISAVIADRDCGAIQYAKAKNIQTNVFNFKKDGWQLLEKQLHQNKPEIIITTFHKIIPKNILNIIPNGFVNLHYSLLPAFKGLIGMKTVKEAKKQNVQFIGATAHFVNEYVDEGNVIAQCAYAVNWNDELVDIFDIIFRNACITLLNALHIIANFNEYNSEETNEKCSLVMYNPSLRFNTQKFNTLFWNQLK